MSTPSPSLVVVGDLLLDVDLDGASHRLSPDAPVPVVDVGEEGRRPGGAGLVARLLAHDGHDVTLVTVMADDDAAGRLRETLEGIRLVTGPSTGPTPVKTRVRANGHAIARIDHGCDPVPVPDVTDEMLAALDAADAIIVADYGRGLAANDRLRAHLARLAPNVPIVWDPHPSGTAPVEGVAVVTPNLSEALRLSEVSGAGVPAATAAASELLARWGVGAVLVTLGGDGALLTRGVEATPHVLPAPRVHAPDTCGAGDRLAASLSAALAAGAELTDAAQRAVDDASAFLARGGVGSLDHEPAPVELGGEGVTALRVAHRTREAGGTVVATGGCFDLLHAGHARTLAAARQLGDCLIVCMNSDDSVRRLKGESRPIIGQDDRAELLLALECVDAVLIFDEDTPEAALSRLQPDLWVKGGDYTIEELPESRLLETWGGRTVTVPFHPARSTTRLASALAKVG
ncbi:bifunctional heptose 7-phosphate kinase/heptose 1-phosphate adenyltransferase [Aeromicrobium camelliae]|uniref:Bifunctional heptose 7-phosphate kinase/heptose 1-phosphate adenyltransferase n=1 Tax=Aeromicrobium camelliae TaxID=1538144 RepID=A0A3N6WAT0_9ACTN|nr:PfkB family carbohydrate kinase [Aeromicrobium camelliae]RQN02152.1 bifunctional heptose 7-phosphate kinase/heptose 1-phosphate adenyltransferase [Aeromicrobium camelliae]